MASEEKTSWVTYVRVLAGIYLLTCMNSLTAYWGNISVYTISYFHFRVKEDTEATSSWMISLSNIGWSLGMFLSKIIQRQTGVRVTMAIGCLCFTGSLFLSFLSVQHSFVAFTITLGAMSGFATGVMHGVQITLLTIWTGPQTLGLACCSILSCQQIGGALVNLIITWFINPNNLISNAGISNAKIFSQPELLDRVPNVFILLGAISLVLACISFLLVKVKSENKIDNDEESRDAQASIVDRLKIGIKNINSLARKSRHNTKPMDVESKDGVVVSDSVTDTQNKTQDVNLTVSECSRLNVTKDSKHKTSEIVLETSHEAETVPCDVTPRQSLKSITFYVLLSILVVTNFAMVVMGSYYKLFGMLYYDDDHFFTNTTVAMNIGTFITISLAGFMCDRFDMKKTLMANLCLMCIFSDFLYLSVRVSKLLYFFLVVIVWGNVFSANVLVSVCFIRYFGNTHATTIYGLASMVGDGFNLIIPICVRYILSTFGWMELYTSQCVFSAMCFLLVVFRLPATSSILDRNAKS